MGRLKSDIPVRAREVLVSRSVREYHLAGRLVGRRLFNAQARLISETPMRDGRKHGREINWDDDGSLVSVEPYVDEKIHGTAKQYDRRGRIIGAYKMVHGTGYDVWRNQKADGQFYISEIHSNVDGALHGFVWWIAPDQKSVQDEKHWCAGQRHGIDREWNFAGKLRRGFPQYWLHDHAVTKRQYIAAARKDSALPPFRLTDNLPRRIFPPEIRRLLAKPTKK
jgi:hypothetical protein